MPPGDNACLFDPKGSLARRCSGLVPRSRHPRRRHAREGDTHASPPSAPRGGEPAKSARKPFPQPITYLRRRNGSFKCGRPRYGFGATPRWGSLPGTELSSPPRRVLLKSLPPWRTGRRGLQQGLGEPRPPLRAMPGPAPGHGAPQKEAARICEAKPATKGNQPPACPARGTSPPRREGYS